MATTDKRMLGTNNVVLRRLIVNKFGSVRRFAREVGLTESMVSHILHGRKKLYSWNAEAFATALGIPEFDVYVFLKKTEE